MQYQVQVEKTSKIQTKLTVKVPAGVVNQRLERGLVQVGKTAKLKGFRPGHVPLPVLKKFYGEDVKHQVFHDLIDESYKAALREHKIMAVSSPKIETPEHKTGDGAHDHSITEGTDLTYTATVDVMPEVEVKNYTGIPLTQEKIEIKDQDVEIVLKRLIDSQAQLNPVTDETHTLKMGEYVDLKFAGGLVTDKGVEPRPGMSGERVLELGSNTLIDGFEEKLVGMKTAETKTFRITFPTDYFEKEMAGKEAEFTCTANGIKEKILPKVDDELAKDLGYENVADMQAKAREHLVNERTQEVERKLKSDLMQVLIEKNAFEIPEALIQAQTRALAQDVAQNLKKQGFDDAMIQEALGAEIGNLKVRAENQVRASLILEAIAKKESFTASSEEVDAEFVKMSENMKTDLTKVKEFYAQNPARRDDLEFRLREDKTVKFLLEKAKLKK